MMSNPKEIAVKLLASAVEKKVRFPKIFDENQLIRGMLDVIRLNCDCLLKFIFLYRMWYYFNDN